MITKAIEFYNKYRQLLLYGFFGTFFAGSNVFLFYILTLFGIDYRISNIISIIIIKILFYLASKFIIFQRKAGTIYGLIKEVALYIFTRSFTALVDLIGLIIFVEYFAFNVIISKCILQVISTTLNFLLSKNLVFRRKRGNINE